MNNDHVFLPYLTDVEFDNELWDAMRDHHYAIRLAKEGIDIPDEIEARYQASIQELSRRNWFNIKVSDDAQA